MPPDVNPRPRYGRDRICPGCGTRVARRATTCFFCGASLTDVARRRFNIPWADLVLFAAIGAVVAFWWLRAPSATDGEGVAMLGVRIVTPAAPATLRAAPDVAALVADDAPPELETPDYTATPPLPTATPAAPLPTVPAAPVRHTVKSGEVLAQIADRYKAKIKDIIDANGLSSNGLIRAGQELVIPIGGPSGGPGPTPTAGQAMIYTVQSGDTLSGIAERFKSQVAWIMQANKIEPGAILRINQVVVVPLTGHTPTPTPSPTPLVAALPAATPTAGYRAPALLTPADGAIVSGEQPVLLTWTSVAVLARDEWYVVSLKAGDDDGGIPAHWTKMTSWRLPAELRGGSRAGTDFVWQVRVRTGSAANPGELVSAPSPERRFTWR